MGLSRGGGNRFSATIWPGFVDAMTALLMVMMFVLTIFLLVQSVLRDQITTQDSELDKLGGEIARLSDALYFWKTDQAPLPDYAQHGKPLDQRLAKMRALNIVFHAKLSTQGERVDRIITLAKELAPKVGADPEKAARAAELAKASPEFVTAATHPDETAFWLYSSGSTGAPKGTRHVHTSLKATADLYGQPILGVRSDDVVFSVAKMFFAYGLGNSLSFPLAVGATMIG